jgi:general stress protein 26
MHLVRLAKELVEAGRPGVLATVDLNGQPRTRWMGTITLKQFPHLYALTSLGSRKTEEIRLNPRVGWMFTSEAENMVLNLFGKAIILEENHEIRRIWPLIEDLSRSYFLQVDTAAQGVVIIDTVIERIECVLPHYSLRYLVEDETFHSDPTQSSALPSMFGGRI